MTISEQLHKLNQYKDYFSKLLLNVQSYDKLRKEEIYYLYNAITNTDLADLCISIDESKTDKSRKEILKGILDNLNDSTREWHYKANSDEFQFVVNLIRNIDRDINRDINRMINAERSSMINTLQKAQVIIQNRKDEIKLKIGSRFFACITDQKGYKNNKELKSLLRKLKVQEWKIKLDQNFEESKHKQLNIAGEESNSKYIRDLTDKTSNEDNNQYKRKGHYITLEEVLNRANPTREDKMLLLKWDIYQVKIFLEDQTLTELDKEALKEIQKDLQKEKNKSKEDFDPKNDGYIQNLRETRDGYVENSRKIRSAIPQSTVETARVSHQPVMRQL